MSARRRPPRRVPSRDVDDIAMLKLADWLHNTAIAAFYIQPDKRRRSARETMEEIYAPLAERIPACDLCADLTTPLWRELGAHRL